MIALLPNKGEGRGGRNSKELAGREGVGGRAGIQAQDISTHTTPA